MKINHAKLECGEDLRWYYDDELFTGISVGTTERGHNIVEMEYKEGLKDGLARIFDKKGTLLEEVSYSEDAYHGTRKIYVNGILESVITYKDGRMVSSEKV